MKNLFKKLFKKTYASLDAENTINFLQNRLQVTQEVNKELLAALKNLENDDNSIPQHAWEIVQAAINKAEGK